MTFIVRHRFVRWIIQVSFWGLIHDDPGSGSVDSPRNRGNVVRDIFTYVTHNSVTSRPISAGVRETVRVLLYVHWLVNRFVSRNVSHTISNPGR